MDDNKPSKTSREVALASMLVVESARFLANMIEQAKDGDPDEMPEGFPEACERLCDAVATLEVVEREEREGAK